MTRQNRCGGVHNRLRNLSAFGQGDFFILRFLRVWFIQHKYLADELYHGTLSLFGNCLRRGMPLQATVVAYFYLDQFMVV